MLINKFVYTLSRLFVVVFLGAHQVNGSNEMNDQCAKHNNTCNPYQQQACCDINLSCELKNPEKYFVCKEKVIIGSPCENDEACKEVEFSKCSRRKFCVCSFNTIALNRTLCSPLLPILGVPCQATFQCKVNNSICISNRCQCKSAYLPRSNNKCELTERLGTPCENDTFCQTYIDHSTCSQEQKCICDPNKYIFKNNKCVVAFSKWCQNDNICLTDNAECIDNLCQCKTNHIYHGLRCIPIYLNETCNEQSDCYAIPFARCSMDNKCVCNHKYISINKSTCAPLLGAFCTRNVQCQPTSLICLVNKCQYQANSSSLLDKISGPIVLGGSCQRDTDCTISNSVCSLNKKCVCGANTFAFNKLTCTLTLFGYCHSDDQCYPVLFRCLNNKCQCKQNYTSVSAHQCADTHLLYSCDNSLDCSDPWHSRCSNHGKCVCKSSNIAINNSTCLPILGGHCWRDDQCIAKNSICIDYQCVCMTNFIAVSGNLCVSIN